MSDLPPLSGGDILLVDDTPANLKLLADTLIAQGYKVRPAASGEQALAAVKARAPDLILLDIRMPGIDGFEVCRRLKSDAKTRDIPVIFISALDSVGDRVQGFELGGVDYITKPFQKEEVLARVKTHLQLRHIQRHLETLVEVRTLALRTLSRVNAALVHAQDEQQLLDDTCRIIIESGGYHAVWVGLSEGEEGTLRPAAHAGSDCAAWVASLLNKGIEGDGTLAQQLLRSREPRMLTATDGFADDDTPPSCHSALVLPLFSEQENLGVMVLFSHREEGSSAGHIALLQEMCGDMAYGLVTLRLRQTHLRDAKRLDHALVQTIEAVGMTLEKRDPYTAGHQRRVSDLAAAIAKERGFSPDRIEGLRLCGLIHDIGKIYIPAEILVKPGKLTEVEFKLIRSHSQVGYDIVQNIEFPWPIAETILQHHERLDGSGYPRGLQGDDILPEAQILMVADVVEAMSSHRPYRASLGIEAALAEILEQRGRRYDAAAVDACLHLFQEGGYTFPPS